MFPSSFHQAYVANTRLLVYWFVRVVHKVLKSNSHSQTKSKVIDGLLTKAQELSRHFTGNYAVQLILIHGTLEESCELVRQLAPSLVCLSCHKVGSNVIERCLTEGSPQSQEVLIEASLKGPKFSSNICVMARDRFGNYVAQKMIEVS